jgi:hypothetical protein
MITFRKMRKGAVAKLKKSLAAARFSYLPQKSTLLDPKRHKKRHK